MVGNDPRKGPQMADDWNILLSTSNLLYPEWQPEYAAALLELDRKKLMARVTDAENAILKRVQALVGSADNHAERQAIEDALASLRVLKKENS